MATYRISRNIEASIIEYIQSQLSSYGWSGITVEKTFQRIYDIPLDTFNKTGAVCVRMEDTTHLSAEIGDDSTRILPLILIDIFATNDGQRLDLKDFLISVLKIGLPLNEYVVNGSTISSRTPTGRIRVTNLEDKPVSFSKDKSSLEIYDRYRHLLTLTVSLGRVEA